MLQRYHRVFDEDGEPPSPAKRFCEIGFAVSAVAYMAVIIMALAHFMVG
jgi:hypothetical protein